MLMDVSEHSKESKKRIVKEGGISAILRAMDSYKTSEGIQEKDAGLLHISHGTRTRSGSQRRQHRGDPSSDGVAQDERSGPRKWMRGSFRLQHTAQRTRSGSQKKAVSDPSSDGVAQDE